MTSRHSLGDTVRLYLDIVEAGDGVVALAPTIAIQRTFDDAWYQASDATWQPTIVENAMTQTHVTFLPGRYHFDFDQSHDDEPGSGRYIVKKRHASSPERLEYEDLVFGPLAGATRLAMCSVQGTIVGADGVPAQSALVRATMIPVFTDGLGRTVQSERIITAFTTQTGDFDLALPRGVRFRLEIPSVGYDRKVLIPDEASVLFTAL